MQETLTPRFQVGGTVQEGALYVPRPADTELPAALLRGEFCYVLAPRQIGKSSLRVRTRRKLEERGIRCAAVDLTQIGGRDSSPNEWYFDLVHQMAKQLGLPGPRTFWEEHALLSPLNRWSCFLRDHVLGKVREPVVVFIDEIDAVLSLSAISRDDFFAAVRATYNARADDPAYRRLTFCLFGVAMPSDLIQDESRTPFNIGRGISLEDFTRAEMDAMLPGLRPVEVRCDPRALLDQVFSWTSGHPYMTQKICEAVLEQGPEPASEADLVRAGVEQLFLRRGRVLEANLSYAENYFLREAQSPRTAQMLRLYGRLRSGERVPAQGQDPIQMALRLTGMAAERQAERQEGGGLWLKVRNPIFATVFDEAWVREKETERLLAEPLRRWLSSGKNDDFLLRGRALREAYDWFRGREDVAPEEFEFLMAGLDAARREERKRARARGLRIAFGLGMLMLSILSMTLSANRRERTARAEAEAAAAQEKLEAERAQEARRLALREKELALFARDEAAAERRRAEHDKKLAQHARQLAEEARQLAEQKTLRAEEDKQLAEQARQHAEDKTFWAEQAMKRAEHEKNLASEIKHQAEKARQKLDAGLGIRAHPQRILDALIHSSLVHSAAFSPDGMMVVTASENTIAQVWDLRSGRSSFLKGHLGPIRSAIFSPDGRRVLTASSDRTARIWDASDGRLLLRLEGHPGPVMSAVFSPDGRRVLTASSDLSARIWDASDGRVLFILGGHAAPVFTAVFAPDGSRVLTASSDGTARLWWAGSGQLLFELEDHAGPVRSAAFSPDGTRVVTASDDRVGRIWDAHSGRLAFRLKGHGEALNAVAFSPDGTRVASASDDKTARIWDAGTGRGLFRLEGHGAQVFSVTFSPDSQRLVTASSDRTARVWDVQSGRILLRLEGHLDQVWSAMFSPDGTQVVTASRDKTARIFPGSIQRWFDAGCSFLVQGPAGAGQPGCEP